MSNPESTTILDNYTVIAPFSWPSTKRAAEDYERRISGSYSSALKAREIAARVGVASTTFILGSADYRIGELCGDTVKKTSIGSVREFASSSPAPRKHTATDTT